MIQYLAYSLDMAQLTHLFSQLLAVDPTVYAVFLGGAAGISGITQIIKKALKLKNDKVIVTLFAVVSFISSGIVYIVTNPNLPPEILGFSTITLMGLATPIYRFVIKPISNILAFYKTYKPQIDEKIQAIEDTVIPQHIVSEAAALNVAPILTTVPVDSSTTLVQTQAEKELIADF